MDIVYYIIFYWMRGKIHHEALIKGHGWERAVNAVIDGHGWNGPGWGNYPFSTNSIFGLRDR
jgi:hypothetical protein